MKLISFLALFVALVASSTSALAPPSPAAAGRRAFLAKAATTTAASIAAVASPAFAVDQYALDLDESYKTEKPEKKSGNGGAVVGGAVAAGLALSLPFFYQNLARMAGVKNSKLK